MKKLLSIISILAIVVLFDSCQKSSPSPSTPPPSVVTPTVTPTPTTVVVDTVGKVRVFFTASFIDVITSPLDYKYDTLNTRIRLNQTYLSCKRNISFEGNLTGLSRTALAPIWMKTGDSLVVEFDSLEYNGANGGGNPINSLNGKLQITEQTFNGSGAVYNNLSPIPLKDNTITVVGTDHNLGIATWSNGTNLASPWFVGKRTKVIYVKP